MVKLTAELIEQSAQYTNAVRDRELDLRGKNAFFLSDSFLLSFVHLFQVKKYIFNLYFQYVKFNN